MTSVDQAERSSGGPHAVSIVMPAYNAGATLAEALESVVAQTMPTWEAIVVNDGSRDQTEPVARAFADRDARIRVVSRDNGGEAAARNTGIASARFDWLLFLDADDWIAPTYLERMTARLAGDPSLDAVHCLSVRVALDGTQVADDYQPPEGDLFPTLARRAAFPIHACVVRRSTVDGLGGFDPSLRTSPDWDLWQRIARTGARFGAVRDVLAYYRMNPQSASLDAERLFADGLTVLIRGHAPDPRVRQPAPEHAAGRPLEELQGQPFYLLCWCAGLKIGAGASALPLLPLLPSMPRVELYADGVAKCLYESVTLPSSQPRAAWEALWPAMRIRMEEFLTALEARAGNEGLAARVLVELKISILRGSETWRPALAHLERTIEERMAPERSALAAARDEQTARVAALDNELRGERERATALDNELAGEHERVTGLDKELLGERERIAALHSERTGLWQQLEGLRDERGQLQGVVASLQTAGEELRSRVTALEAEVQRLRQCGDELSREKASLERALETERQYAADLGAQLDRLDTARWVRLGRGAGVLPTAARPVKKDRTE